MANTDTDASFDDYDGVADKIDPQDPRLSLKRPSVRRMKKWPVILIIGFVAMFVGAVLIVALMPPSEVEREVQHTRIDPDMIRQSMPESLRNASGQYALVEAPKVRIPDKVVPKLGPPLPGDVGAMMVDQPSSTMQGQLSDEERERLEMLKKAKTATLFFPGLDNTAGAAAQFAQPNVQLGQALNKALSGLQGATDPEAVLAGGSGAILGGGDLNNQGGKSKFLSTAGRGRDAYLKSQLHDPVSPYEVKAGSILPASLITGINSDLPGDITAQVRESVYDTATGNYLLIPQGTRLFGQYDSAVTFGQDRVLVVWSRLIFPDGASISLEGMPGVDLSGYAGYADKVNNHWLRLISGVVLSSLLAATSESSASTGITTSFEDRALSSAGQEINRAGQMLTRKNLNLQPTIDIRPGFSINVMVNKDMILRPYNG